jgi:hypothetical protein
MLATVMRCGRRVAAFGAKRPLRVQRVEVDHSPSFASMAQRPNFSAEKLAFFLLEPHPKMPDLSLSRKEADDLAAYIAEQRR